MVASKKSSKAARICVFLLSVLLLQNAASFALAEQPLYCSADESESDPALKEMTYDVGDGPQTTMVYVEPDITTFYKGEPPASTKVVPKFNGFQGKFINLSNQPLTLYWEASAGGAKHIMRNHKPFAASGTATFPGHRFLFTPINKPDQVLHYMIVQEYPENVYIYDPYHVDGDPEQTEKNLQVLSKDERHKYDLWRKTLAFNEQYRNFTGRSYLANYLRNPPMHYMWRAGYFGQEHWVVTNETHFVSMPPQDQLEPVVFEKTSSRNLAKENNNNERYLQEYRDPTQSTLNMTLKVLSCVPRAFEIKNFLSQTEVDHILKIAGGIELSLSSTGEAGATEEEKANEDTRRTRTSYNSWVGREQSPILDAIYRRAADLMRIDEKLLRQRTLEESKEYFDNGSYTKPLCESLQLVHYDKTQEYTAHHDFGFSRIDNPHQGARFGTLLLYLNEPEAGGETSFPRWANAETFHELKIKPEVGKAILFYSQLPDGNMDDFSHHAAKPVIKGEKWLINLWTWDPRYD